jgi:hypothetical protein
VRQLEFTNSGRERKRRLHASRRRKTTRYNNNFKESFKDKIKRRRRIGRL